MDVVVLDVPRNGRACGGEEIVGEDQAEVAIGRKRWGFESLG